LRKAARCLPISAQRASPSAVFAEDADAITFLERLSFDKIKAVLGHVAHALGGIELESHRA
jgi:hypothetical protein